MSRSARLLAAALLLLLAGLCLFACGQGGEDSTTNGKQASHGHPPEGEKSIERFGSEAAGAQRQAILAAEQGYLRALSLAEFKRACALLAAPAHESLTQLAPGRLRAGGCAAILPRLLSTRAPATARAQAEGEVRKVRAGGERAFVVFHAPGAKLFVFTMVREGGQWKASTAGPSVLVPSLGTG
jgi:hypothetical protein